MEVMQNQVLELYKLYVGTAEKVTENRLKSNVFFISLNGLVLSIYETYAITHLLIVGVFLNLLWRDWIVSSKKLNFAKFKVIFNMEEKLPIKCFTLEEQFYNDGRRVNHTKIEQWMPCLLIALYIFFIFRTPSVSRFICALITQ